MFKDNSGRRTHVWLFKELQNWGVWSLGASGAQRLCLLEDLAQIPQKYYLLCNMNEAELQIWTLILMGSWLSQSISSSKILESLRKFVFTTERAFNTVLLQETGQSPGIQRKRKEHTNLEWLLYMKVSWDNKAKSFLHLESAPTC